MSTAELIKARDFLLAHRTDYATAYLDFHWPELTNFNWALDWFDAVLAKGPLANQTALQIVGDGAARLTFEELSQRSSRLANGLRALGVKRGDRIGTTSVAAPQAVSSRVARYSLTARLDLSGSRSLRHSLPAIERCLLASAAIRLASTAKPSPPTKPALMQASTTRSNTRRKTSPLRNRSLRARENAAWSGIASSMPSLQNQR